MNVHEANRTTEFSLPLWSAAEYLDTSFSDGLVLRALICCLAVGKWQWCIMSIRADGGEVIGLGTERTVEKARQTAAAELDKCIRDPLV